MSKLTYILITLFSIVVTLIASYVHHTFILGFHTPKLTHYIVPFFVGLFFGILLSVTIKLYIPLKKKERGLEKLATIDELTGLPNRRLTLEVLNHEISVARRYRKPLSVAMIDVDNFKEINDTFGHQVGDRVLKEIASTIREDLRENDFVGRFGGEEFLVILPNTDEKAAFKVIDRVRESVKEKVIVPTGEVKISAGVASLRDGDNAYSIINRADEALYRAKREGRDRVIVY